MKLSAAISAVQLKDGTLTPLTSPEARWRAARALLEANGWSLESLTPGLPEDGVDEELVFRRKTLVPR
jgi:hypothetical protein